MTHFSFFSVVRHTLVEICPTYSLPELILGAELYFCPKWFRRAFLFYLITKFVIVGLWRQSLECLHFFASWPSPSMIIVTTAVNHLHRFVCVCVCVCVFTEHYSALFVLPVQISLTHDYFFFVPDQLMMCVCFLGWAVLDLERFSHAGHAWPNLCFPKEHFGKAFLFSLLFISQIIRSFCLVSRSQKSNLFVISLSLSNTQLISFWKALIHRKHPKTATTIGMIRFFFRFCVGPVFKYYFFSPKKESWLARVLHYSTWLPDWPGLESIEKWLEGLVRSVLCCFLPSGGDATVVFFCCLYVWWIKIKSVQC